MLVPCSSFFTPDALKQLFSRLPVRGIAGYLKLLLAEQFALKGFFQDALPQSFRFFK